MITPSFWQDKKVFLTGHTGFKGSWLSIWLHSLGAEVKGYSLAPPTDISLYVEANVDSIVNSDIANIKDFEKLRASMVDFNPDVLIHMAAQPLVKYSYKEPIETYESNVMGTVKVLEAARSCPQLKSIVNITTDKCYENKEWQWGYRENEPFGGYDPYSSSKACAELVTSAYRDSFLKEQKVGVATVRAGNVIGGGDWADDRLIPDILRAFEKNSPVVVRNPKATRPWQHVLEPLSGYLILAEKLYYEPDRFAEGWNFGPRDEDVQPVDWILDKMVAKWPNSSWSLDDGEHPHEAGFLKLDISKANARLSWKPVWKLEQVLLKIIDWQQAWLRKEDMFVVCQNEINEYMRDMNNGYN